MSPIERAWREASLDWHDELGAALVRELDEDDALTAIQVVRKFCVPAPSYQGAIEENERLKRDLASLTDYGQSIERDRERLRGEVARLTARWGR
jgi:hypothetical protein